MRKIIYGIFCALTAALLLAGCGQTAAVPNEFGWYQDFDAAQKVALKENKNIIVLYTSDDTDGVSPELKSSLFHTQEFKETFDEKFVFCDLDLSRELFRKAMPDKEKASKEDLKNAKHFRKILDARMKFRTDYSINNTPVVMFLTKQGYPIVKQTYVPVQSVQEFKTSVEEFDERTQLINDLVANVDSAKGVEKVKAIEDLCQIIKSDSQFLLTPLFKQVEKLDPKNETGLVGRYILKVATSESLDAAKERKLDKVAEPYLKAAKNKKLSPQEKQQAYYAAAYVLASNTPEPEITVKIISILKKAIEVDPESALGKQCAIRLEQFEEFKIRQDEGIRREKEQKKAAKDSENSEQEGPQPKPAE